MPRMIVLAGISIHMLYLVFVVCVDSFIHNLFFDNSLRWASIGDGLILEIIRTYI